MSVRVDITRFAPRPVAMLDSETGVAAAQLNADRTRGIGPGSPSRVVENVQTHLAAAGFGLQSVDGKFDARTEAAVRRFQSRSGLPVTGRVDFATWAKLSSASYYADSFQGFGRST